MVSELVKGNVNDGEWVVVWQWYGGSVRVMVNVLINDGERYNDYDDDWISVKEWLSMWLYTCVSLMVILRVSVSVMVYDGVLVWWWECVCEYDGVSVWMWWYKI